MFDLHCHMLPALDDGPSEMEGTLDLAEQLVQVGFTDVACSPHYGEGPGGDAPLESISTTRLLVQEELNRRSIPLRLHANAEHYLTALLFERLERKEVVPLGDSSWLLVEFPWQVLSAIEEVIFRLQTKGFKILLAHAERCTYLDNALLETLVERGVRAQINLTSFLGVHGRQVKKRAFAISDAGLGHVLATDLHAPHDAARFLKESMSLIIDRYGSSALDTALCVNPKGLLNDQPAAAISPFVIKQ